MATVVIFNEGATPENVVGVFESVHTPDFSGRTDAVINPDVSTLSNVSLKYWKHSGGDIVEMSQAEKDAVDAAAQQAHDDAKVSSINDLDLTIKQAFLSWLMVFNSKVPAQYQVTPQELKDQALSDWGP